MTTTTDLSAERAILHWAADRIEADYGDEEGDGIAELMRVWADNLDVAPATYALPAEPPVPPEPATSSEEPS